jgi:galactokinase/mevalonate kinase-like predicted kinase
VNGKDFHESQTIRHSPAALAVEIASDTVRRELLIFTRWLLRSKDVLASQLRTYDLQTNSASLALALDKLPA